MACKLCTEKPISTVRQLDRDINSGEFSVLELAENYKIKKKRILFHMKKCLGGVPQTGYSTLQNSLRSLQSLAKAVKEEYDGINPYEYEDEEGSDVSKSHTIRRYVEVQREIRETIMALNRIKPSEELAIEIVDLVIAPLVSQTVRICTEELSRLRQDLTRVLGKDSYGRIDAGIKEAMSRLGQRLSQETDQVNPNLKKVLNTEHARKQTKSPTKQIH